mmetsp:Transcript_69774/g.204222  ORF Transcript_69774/g.204222 Transcript_69774/m.204222 type:complete len:132 (+) Transcript_69774:131-526(+)
MAGPGCVIEAMEEWLASDAFGEAWRECYDRASRGSSRSDRNISESVLVQTTVAVHAHLPPGALQMLIPEPDREFLRGALEHIGLDDPARAGLPDLEHFEAALVVVYTQLAHCAEALRGQLPGLEALLRPVC